MAFDATPMRAMLFPSIRDPVVTAAFVYVPPGHPYMFVAAVLPITRRPYVPHSRSRHDLDARRRWGDVDIDGDSGASQSGYDHRAPRQA